jgi:hypothetical protein
MNTFRTSKNEGQVSFPKGGLFMKGKKPKFLNGNVSAVKVFKNKENVFKTGNRGTGYYKNEGQVSFPKGGLFMKGKKPKFLNGNVSAVKVFKNKENYVQSNVFKGVRPGFVFKTGNRGTGYYKNEGPATFYGPSKPNNNVKPNNVKPTNNVKPNTNTNTKPNNTK